MENEIKLTATSKKQYASHGLQLDRLKDQSLREQVLVEAQNLLPAGIRVTAKVVRMVVEKINNEQVTTTNEKKEE
jgi:hypothetical protein